MSATALISFSPYNSPGGREHFYLCFAGEEMEAQRTQDTHPKAHSLLVMELL